LQALGLTAHQAEVLLWVAQGKSNGEVGVILGMREGTVRKHLEHIYTRLGVEHRHAATYRALEVLGLPREDEVSGDRGP
jgi:DNA-binding CsgD family transcriptional regulator